MWEIGQNNVGIREVTCVLMAKGELCVRPPRQVTGGYFSQGYVRVNAIVVIYFLIPLDDS